MQPNREIIPNKFGVAFRRVVAQTNAGVRMESFDSTVIEVQKDDFLPFLETLSLSNSSNDKGNKHNNGTYCEIILIRK